MPTYGIQIKNASNQITMDSTTRRASIILQNSVTVYSGNTQYTAPGTGPGLQNRWLGESNYIDVTGVTPAFTSSNTNIYQVFFYAPLFHTQGFSEVVTVSRINSNFKFQFWPFSQGTSILIKYMVFRF